MATIGKKSVRGRDWEFGTDMYVCMLVAQSCPTLLKPMDCT